MKSSFDSCSQHEPRHENFEELAALAAVGELSALELERLRVHLAECPRCRETYEAFADVASNDLGVAAADREFVEVEHVSLANPLTNTDETEPREQLEHLRDRLKTDDSRLPSGSHASQVRAQPGDRATERSVRPLAVYTIAAMILVSLTVAGGVAWWRSSRALSAERARTRELQSIADSLRGQRDDRAGSNGAVLRSLEESQQARDTLKRSLSASEAKNRELAAREKASEEKLTAAIAGAERLQQQLEAGNEDRARLAKLQQDSDVKLREALVELYQARQAPVQTVAKNEAHGDTNSASDAQPAFEGGASTVSPSEVEARNLFGARDLHIVDVYDVSGDGQTKRTYGRVYYVEKKLLVFYAFDLQNRQNRKPAVFQAWGYREANVGKPLSLGFFAIDDSNVSRWVLTVNRADVLSHIDAVFVTVEPPGGSAAPRGKKVLYANLIGPPNHP